MTDPYCQHLDWLHAQHARAAAAADAARTDETRIAQGGIAAGLQQAIIHAIGAFEGAAARDIYVQTLAVETP